MIVKKQPKKHSFTNDIILFFSNTRHLKLYYAPYWPILWDIFCVRARVHACVRCVRCKCKRVWHCFSTTLLYTSQCLPSPPPAAPPRYAACACCSAVDGSHAPAPLFITRPRRASRKRAPTISWILYTKRLAAGGWWRVLPPAVGGGGGGADPRSAWTSRRPGNGSRNRRRRRMTYTGLL